MEKFTVNVSFEFDEEFINDVLTTAFEGGSNYWIDYVTPVTEAASGHTEFYSERVAGGGSITIMPDEDPGIEGHEEGVPFLLDRPAFIKGFQQYLAWGFEKSRSVYTDPGDIDATEADVILQFALFGEVIYSG